MLLGLSLAAFIKMHVLISVTGIISGLIVLSGMLAVEKMPVWTAIFLLTTVLTSVTGFMFPAVTLTPAAIVGIISLVVLAGALLALYVLRLRGPWRWIYVVTAVTALYLNVFVLVVQAFQKIPLLNQFAPTGTEPPFIVAQALVLAAFIALGVMAVRGFHPERASAA